jgi:Flp pilus assembly protein TadD
LSVLACLCGVATKESMAAAPLVVMLYDRVFVFSSLHDALRVRARLYAGFVAAWVALAVLIWVRPHSTVGFSGGVDAWTYLLNQAEVIPHYLRLVFWPDALVLDYGPPRPLQLRDVLGPGLVVVALLVATIVALVRWPMVGFLGAAFFLTLAPDSSIVPVVTEAGAERRMYLPLAAIAVLVATAGWMLFDRARSVWREHYRLITTAAIAVAMVWVAALAARTVYRNAEYASGLLIWGTSVERRPHGRSRMSYAHALAEGGDTDASLVQLRQAVDDYPAARYALGTELAARGQLDDAIPELRAFIAEDPSHPNRIPARSLLGRVLWSRGRFDESADQFREILELAPQSIDAHASLGDVMLQQKQYAEAIAHYRTVAGLRPDVADWQIKLGTALEGQGEVEEAVSTFKKALQLDPAARMAHLKLAEIFLRLRQGEDAASHAREALRIESGDALAHNLLGAALASQGKLAEAVEHFRAAVELAPDLPDARNNLDRAARLLGDRR